MIKHLWPVRITNWTYVQIQKQFPELRASWFPQLVREHQDGLFHLWPTHQVREVFDTFFLFFGIQYCRFSFAILHNVIGLESFSHLQDSTKHVRKSHTWQTRISIITCPNQSHHFCLLEHPGVWYSEGEAAQLGWQRDLVRHEGPILLSRLLQRTVTSLADLAANSCLENRESSPKWLI